MIPSGSEALLAEVSSFRYVLVGLALVWALTSLRSRPAVMVLCGTLLTQCAIGYWILVLGAPYGVGVDMKTTRIAADAVAVASSGDASEAFVAGAPLEAHWLASLAGLGLPGSIALWLPTLLPLMAGPIVAWLVLIVWRRRCRATLGAVLWLLFSTDGLSCLRGYGFLPGLWPRPGWSLLLLGWVTALLVADRIGRRALSVTTLSVVVIMTLMSSYVDPPCSSGRETFALALLVEQGFWLLLGGIGLWNDRRGVPLALCISGLGVLAVGSVRTIDPWAGHAVLRLGLILAATRPIMRLLYRFHRVFMIKRFVLAFNLRRSRPGWALLILAAASSGFIVSWHPLKEDVLAGRTAEKRDLWMVLRSSLSWIRENTPSSSVVAASDHYAVFVSASTGRRVLRCPSVLPAPDDGNRILFERRLIRGRRWAHLARRFGVTHVLVGPGDFTALGLEHPGQLEGRPGLALRHADRATFHVYEILSAEAP